MALHQVALFVKDLDASVAFYAGVLGAPPTTREDTWVVFDTGGASLGLHAIPPHIADDIVVTAPPEPREDSPVKLVLAVAATDDLAARVEALGGVVLRRGWGGVDYTDVEGNVFTTTA
jgi:catechol 2,3-dioxygenase-like lactoylglutathione lyase family enzyme